MSAVILKACAAAMAPVVVRGQTEMALTLDMTVEQRKAAVVQLLGVGWGEEDAYNWLRSEFPSWFEAEVV
jgi:hypothetical protein